jgi:hypothetical protein
MNIWFFYIGFFILIMIFSIVFSKKNSKLEHFDQYKSYKLYNGDYWQEYRIGDLYRFGTFVGCGYKNKGCNDDKYHMKYFPNSIAYFYQVYNPKNLKQNKIAMKKAIEEVIRMQKKHDNLKNVLHLRVGDVMLLSNRAKQNIYSKNDDKIWWSEYLKWCKQNQLREVLIIAGSHNVKSRQKWKPSLDFIFKIKCLLEANGIHVELKIGGSPDDDIISAFSAKYFASTGGTFGKLIKELSKHNNVNVYEN